MGETIKDLSNVNDSTTDNDGQKDCLKFDFEILKVALIKLFQKQKVLY